MMFKLIRVCKVVFIIFLVCAFGDLIASIIQEMTEPVVRPDYYFVGGPKQYVPVFIDRLAKASFFYLCAITIEKWCKKKDEAIKGARYPLFKNPENLTDGQAATIELIAKSNPRLYRAYLLKEMLRLLFQHTFSGAKGELERWISWARRCRIPPFVELQKKICRHFDAILSTIKHGLSNARIEAINNKIKLTVRMGYGFRNIDHLIALVMLRCSDVNLVLPGRA